LRAKPRYILHFYSAPFEWPILQQLFGHFFAETVVSRYLHLLVRGLILEEVGLLVFQEETSNSRWPNHQGTCCELGLFLPGTLNRKQRGMACRLHAGGYYTPHLQLLGHLRNVSETATSNVDTMVLVGKPCAKGAGSPTASSKAHTTNSSLHLPLSHKKGAKRCPPSPSSPPCAGHAASADRSTAKRAYSASVATLVEITLS
jgi:hypothetical protein